MVGAFYATSTVTGYPCRGLSSDFLLSSILFHVKFNVKMLNSMLNVKFNVLLSSMLKWRKIPLSNSKRVNVTKNEIDF